MTDTLRVSELFWSPQGEGARSGEVSLFVRLQGCSAKHACAASGVACDTEFESGREVGLEQLLAEARELMLPWEEAGWVVWTGGEPLDQLTPDVVRWFAERGFRQALETSGVRPLAGEFRQLFDWVTCSPKVAEHVLAKHFGEPGVKGHPDCHVHELRYVRHAGQTVPQPALRAATYFLSPHSDGLTVNRRNVAHVVELCRADPRWRVSVQQHKLWGVL